MSNKDDILKGENELGTNSKVINIFHNALRESFFSDKDHLLPFDSTILCFEKIKRNKLVSGKSKSISWQEIKQIFKIDYKSFLKSISSEKNIFSIDRFLIGTKTISLTHAIDFKQSEPTISYSNYKKDINPETNYLERSFSFYDDFKTKFTTQLEKEKYTHIFLGSTGWNNTQSESLKSYKKWQNTLMQKAKEDNIEFKPYFIGLTWPSFWSFFSSGITSKIDYFNKANDADELGTLHLNHFLWKIIVPCIQQSNHKHKLVVIGHSFGARILSRAIHSRMFFTDLNYTNNELEKFKIDRFFIFQGAFNIKRYLPIKSGESGIYAIDSPVKLTVATSSLYDNAVPLAFWTSHIGSKKTLRNFNSRAEYSYSKFDLLYSDSFGKVNGSFGEKRYKIIIADEFIRNHNDVFSEKAASHMFQFLK